MTPPIPRSALLLGLSGALPFAGALGLCVAARVLDPATQTGFATAPTVADLPGVGAALAVHYGIVILAFMSGVLWGFATRADQGTATRGYALSVLPALWGFFTTLGPTDLSLIALILGFAALLTLDRWFWTRALAPAWWMRLRLLLTGLVLTCLLGVLALG